MPVGCQKKRTHTRVSTRVNEARGALRQKETGGNAQECLASVTRLLAGGQHAFLGGSLRQRLVQLRPATQVDTEANQGGWRRARLARRVAAASTSL